MSDRRADASCLPESRISFAKTEAEPKKPCNGAGRRARAHALLTFAANRTSPRFADSTQKVRRRSGATCAPRTESYAAFDVQRPGPGEGHGRRVPDEHASRTRSCSSRPTSRGCSNGSPAATRVSTARNATPSTPWSRTASSSRAATRSSERLGEYFTNLREDTELMKVTVLTTLQCNFACDYCFQGDHGDYNKFAAKMSLDTARKVALWIEHAPRRGEAREVPPHAVRR